MHALYLDNNATTPLLPAVAEALHEAAARGYANPASQHAAGRQARAALEEAREGIAAILGAEVERFEADRLIFTSGGTEANNLALRGLGGAQPGKLIISAIEHPSIADTADFLKVQGWPVARLPVDRRGVVQLDRLRELLTPEVKLVSVMLGNNETGVLQPVGEIAKLCRAAGALVHTDAVQVVGKLPVDFRALGVDAMTFTAHKFHGPLGIGALLVRPGVKLDPLHFGGFQQLGLRPGTEPVVLAIGMHRALQIWQGEQTKRREHLMALRERFESQLHAALPEIVIHGADAARLPHTVNASFPGIDRQRLLLALDLAGVACSTGSACASGSSEPSPVLLAMGLPEAWIASSLRFSFGAQNTPAEIDEAVERILKVYNHLQGRESRRNLAATPPAAPKKSL